MPNVVFCDSFDHYAFADMGKKGWTLVGNQNSLATGRNSTTAVKLGQYGINPGYAERTIAELSTVYVECAFQFATFTDEPFLYLLNSGTKHLEVELTATGELMVTRNGTSLGVTTGLGLLANTWYHLGFCGTVHDTAGAFDLRVNGISKLSATGVDTRNGATSTVNQIRISSANNNYVWFDDLVISTDGFCGDCRVQAVLPQGAGNYSQWTPSAGSGYQCVDDASMNSDTDYVSSSTAGQRNSYDFADLPTSGAVKAVQHVATMRKDDAGSRTAKQFARYDGTDYDGSAVSVTDSYLMQQRVMITNPATGAAWTLAQINAAEFGTKLES